MSCALKKLLEGIGDLHHVPINPGQDRRGTCGDLSQGMDTTSQRLPQKGVKGFPPTVVPYDIARYCDSIAAIPPIARILSQPSQQSPSRERYPPLVPSFTHRHISAIPHFAATYRARYLCDIPGSRAAKRGCFKRGGFPIWTCPSFFVPFCPVWDFPDFSRIFSICSGMVRGFSRFVPFLFLGLLRAPTRNSPERVGDTIWTFPEKSFQTPGFGNPPV